jgi:hypothetical protein
MFIFFYFKSFFSCLISLNFFFLVICRLLYVVLINIFCLWILLELLHRNNIIIKNIRIDKYLIIQKFLKRCLFFTGLFSITLLSFILRKVHFLLVNVLFRKLLLLGHSCLTIFKNQQAMRMKLPAFYPVRLLAENIFWLIIVSSYENMRRLYYGSL